MATIRVVGFVIHHGWVFVTLRPPDHLDTANYKIPLEREVLHRFLASSITGDGVNQDWAPCGMWALGGGQLQTIGNTPKKLLLILYQSCDYR